ncbi:MAG TPA: alpha/beta hydrolase-fold protein [Polyangiaceae bacterium]|nr:alpha/beta hydrolase-fold protein [Polyangiaceae bacterium]
MRTPRSLSFSILALAIPLTFAPACGDDDDGGPSNGGSGGNAGKSGGSGAGGVSGANGSGGGSGSGGASGAGGAGGAGGGSGVACTSTGGPGLAGLEALIAALPPLPIAERNARVEGFLRDVAYQGGWPMCDAGRFVFAHFDPQNAASVPSVAGDFNAWQPDAAPMTRALEGYGLFYAVLPIDLPAADKRLYKLVRDGAYQADPQARRFGFDENGQHSLLAENPARGRFERWPAFQGVAPIAPRPLYVYVPPAAPGPLPVLYMHDGQNLFQGGGPFGSWDLLPVYDAEIAAGRARPALVVGVANTDDRFAEYTHVADTITGLGTVGGGADEYVDFVADRVKPFVDANYPTLADRDHTAILGSSLGGLVSFYAALKRPEVFAFAGSMSGTFGWGSIAPGPDGDDTLIDLFTTKLDVSLYLDSGGGDGNSDADNDDCLDADNDGVHDDVPSAGDNFCENVDMRDKLVALGWQTGVDLKYAFVKGASHSEASWKARLPGALSGWFPGPPVP